jgi:hypothetical protein
MFKKFTFIIPLVIFLIAYLFYALVTFRYYGITWDESDVYSSGRMTWTHLGTRLAPDEPLLMSKTPGSEIRAVYDSAYPAILYKLNKAESYELYHLLNMLFNSLGFIAAYLMIWKYYKNSWFALIGPIFLVLLPRYFGDFPANPKDAPFATMYLVALAVVYYAADIRNRYFQILLLGGTIGLLQSFRIVGMNVLLTLGAYEAYLYLKRNIDLLEVGTAVRWILDTVMRITIIALIAMLITTVSWPYLGSSFFKHLLDILRTSREYPWFGPTLTNGMQMYSFMLPWHYLPTWIVVTTPIFILFLCALAIYRAFKTNFKHPLHFLLIFSLILNFSIYFLSRPHMYDGLRHFMFVLPIMGVLAAVSFIEIMKYGTAWVRNGIGLFVVVNAVLVLISYQQLFPYQYIYFNELVGGLRRAGQHYETDYWGASFREATLWVKEHTEKEGRTVTVHTCAHPFISVYYFAPHMQWVAKPWEAEYSICYTRADEHKGMVGKTIHVVKRDGVALNYIKYNNDR